jgi:phosphoribosylanthranilate isomerase
MIIQIYEIQKPEEAERCIELGVDHIGSVLLRESDWKDPDIKAVMGITNGTATKNSLIPLFRNREILFKALDYYQPDFVHFCESLVDERGRTLDLENHIRLQQEVKAAFRGMAIIRSIPILKNGAPGHLPTLDIASRMEPYSDYFLTDTWLGKEPVAGYIGITGKACDWGMARALVVQSRIPVILAGGLSPSNVYGALRAVLPDGADSCTRTNRVDRKGRPVRFEKDFAKVAQFVQEVRRAEKESGREKANEKSV